MPLLLPIASLLTVAITYKTVGKTSQKMAKRRKRKEKNEI